MAPTTRKKVDKPVSSVRRRVVNPDELEPVGNYFASGASRDLEFVSTGCEVLNCVLGGGYVLGRITNIVGDKSTGKTLQAIEACANFIKEYPDGVIRYAEAEAAFDQPYAAALGMPVDKTEFVDQIQTVEDFYEDLESTIAKLSGRPCIYILDSLDSLSDRAEQKRDIDEGSYNMQKAKKLGEMFRRTVQNISGARVLLIIISQIRDKIGVTFGEKHTRSGGKALDFYASQVLWLAEVEKTTKVIDKVERVIGIRVKATCKKNKVGLPFRKCEYPLLFGYGIDDLTANIEWLKDVGRLEDLKELGFSAEGYKVRVNNLRNKGGPDVVELRTKLNACVRKNWEVIETKFLPTSRKY